MYITLTNANPAFRGQQLAINSEMIATMWHNQVLRDDGTLEGVTYIFCPPHGTWEVSDLLTDIVTELNNNAWK